jgi:hypothetical protein
MRNTILFFLLAVMLSPGIMAEQRSASDAQNVASNYLRTKASHHLMGVSTQSPQLSLSMTGTNADNKVDYYVFNNGKDNGFIIVSGDDKAAPVLGYSDSGSFDANDIPDGMRYWLDCYAEQMQYLRSHPESAYVAPRSRPNVFITPLLTCKWNQNSPFNNMCPTYGTAQNHAVTGCVATATAQVMYYHKWPQQGSSEFTYVCNVNGEGEQTLSADFGSTTYDWNNMLDYYAPNGYSEAEGNAVATLMSHVGIASHMEYGSISSTATYAAMEALRLYFGYNSGMRIYNRITMNAAQWDSLLMNELLNARPIIFSAATPKGGGHCFVLDGINADGYYHINWGWGGVSDGYFLITALSPSDQGIGSYEGGYNASQQIVANVYPDKGEPVPERFLEGICYKFWSAVDHVNLGQNANLHYRFLQFNSYGYGLSSDITIGFMLADINGNIVQFTSDNTHTSNFNFGTNYSLLNDKAFIYHTPASLADGDYRLWFMYKLANPAITSYSYLANCPNIPRFISVKVQNGVMYFSTPVTESGQLSVTDLSAPEEVGAGNKMGVSASISNAGKEYFDNVYFALIDNNDNYKIYDPININVPTGGKVTINSILTAPTEPGEYELAVLNKDFAKIGGGTVTVMVQESSNYLLTINTQLQVNSYYMDMDNVGGTAVLGNTGTGDYVGPIPYMILSEDSKQILYRGNTNVVTIPAGGTATVNINTHFERVPQVIYKMCLRDPKYPDKNVIWGAQVPFELNGTWPTTLLDKLVKDGINDGDYRIADNLTIADSHDQSVFATNGHGSWIEVKCGDNFGAVNAMGALKAGTVWGKYFMTDGNPSITLTQLPEAGVVQEGVVEKLDLSKPYTPVPDQVIDFSGFYFVENGKDVIYAYDGSDGDKGQAVPISFDWLSGFAPLTEGACYDMHGVVMLTAATSGAPALMTDGAVPANYIVYLTKVPDVVTAIDQINGSGVKVNVASGTINVAGASNVVIYNTAGALVSSKPTAQLPAGVYVVVADGKSYKVIVK